MATAMIKSSHSNDAEFRAVHKAISDLIKASGMIQEPRAADIDFTTVLRPAANTSAGTEVFRLPGADPIWVEISYACSVNTTRAAVWMRLSDAYDAPTETVSNTMFGATTALFNGSTGNYFDILSVDACYAYCDSDTFVLTLWTTQFRGTVQMLMTFLFERTRDAQGVADGRGVFVHHSCSASGGGRMLDSAGESSGSFIYSGLPLYIPNVVGLTSGWTSGVLTVYPALSHTRAPGNPMQSCAGIYRADVSIGSTIAVPILGTSCTFVVCQPYSIYWGPPGNAGSLLARIA